MLELLHPDEWQAVRPGEIHHSTLRGARGSVPRVHVDALHVVRKAQGPMNLRQKSCKLRESVPHKVSPLVLGMINNPASESISFALSSTKREAALPECVKSEQKFDD